MIVFSKLKNNLRLSIGWGRVSKQRFIFQSHTRYWDVHVQCAWFSDPPLSPRHSILCHANDSQGLVVVDHRLCGGHRAVPRHWWSTWLEGHSRGMAPVVAPPHSQARPPGRRPLSHSNLISIPWPRNVPNGPKGPYRNQIKIMRMVCQTDSLIQMWRVCEMV